MFFLVVLAHTDEQYNNLLNTRELIIVINVRLGSFISTSYVSTAHVCSWQENVTVVRHSTSSFSECHSVIVKQALKC